MRVTWKDSDARKCPPTKYRKVTITRYNNGWITDIEGDMNIYASQDVTKNAIDKLLGGKPRRTTESRSKKGIKILGKRSG